MRKNILSAVAGAALVVLIASGCQAAPPDITPDRAEAFQSRVLAVTTAVADGGYAAALETLTSLQTELDAAAADGTLSFARHQRIEAAMDVVRADIQAAIDAQTAPAPAPEPEESTAPVEEEEATPAPETDAEKKAREAEEKAAEEEAKKAAEDQKKADEKAADEAKKAAEEAKKKAEEEAKKTTEPIDESVDGED